jgi:hypothetical protein
MEVCLPATRTFAATGAAAKAVMVEGAKPSKPAARRIVGRQWNAAVSFMSKWSK